MARNIHSNYFEDNYLKHECKSCRRSFIVGERLSEGHPIACPYCQSSDVEATVMANEENTEEMQMGCVGIYFHTYSDGALMLYTQSEFVTAMNEAFSNGNKSMPLGSHYIFMEAFCKKRDSI